MAQPGFHPSRNLIQAGKTETERAGRQAREGLSIQIQKSRNFERAEVTRDEQADL
jgi:hypothetical protein